MKYKTMYKSTVSSLTAVAERCYVEPQKLVDALIAAWKTLNMQEIAGLEIHCRATTQDSATFLITKDGKVITQFPVKSWILASPDVLKGEINRSAVKTPAPKRGPEHSAEKKIAELKMGMWVNINAEVMEITPKKRVITSYGTQAHISKAKIADETGSIILNLWNKNIGRIRVGDKIEIKRGRITRYSGNIIITLRKQSDLTVKKI